MRWFYLLLSLFILMTGCTEETEAPSQRISEYYNVDSLLESQMQALIDNKALLIKEVVYRGNEETDTLALTKELLAQELLMFNEMNINKPVLSGRYATLSEEQQGLQFTRYQADEPDDLRVNYLEIYRQQGRVIRLEALFSDRNVLYNSTRKLVLRLNEAQMPQSYSIEGIQKMIFRDEVAYSIEGRFVY